MFSQVLLAAAYVFILTAAGNFVFRVFMRGKSEAANPFLAAPPKIGRTIGNIERLLVATGVFAGSWEILLAVVALKTVARFKELDERNEAEYFLVGSMFSILWSIMVTALFVMFDKYLDLGILATLRSLVTA